MAAHLSASCVIPMTTDSGKELNTMSQLHKTPFRYRWMLATTIVATLAAIAGSAGHKLYTCYRTALWNQLDVLQAEHPNTFPVFDIPGYSEGLDQLHHLEEVLTRCMLAVILIGFLATLLFFVVAMREQYRLTRARGAIVYTLIGLSILLPAVSYIKMTFSERELSVNFTLILIASILIPLVLLVVLQYASWPPKALSPMFSPWIGVPGYLAPFALWAPSYMDIGDSWSLSAPTLSECFAIFQWATVCLMIVDVVVYRVALHRQIRAQPAPAEAYETESGKRR